VVPNAVVSNTVAPVWLSAPGDVNALDASLWSRSVARASDGELMVGGVSATQLAKRFGTPLYVVDEDDARARASNVRETLDTAFQKIGTTVTTYYAGKAFLTIEIAQWMVEAGLNIDVCSGGELAVVLAAGIAPDRLGFHGNNKSVAEIDRAVSVGVGTIIIDSEIEIERVAAAARLHGTVQRVRLRVNSGVHAHTHEYLATAHDDQKFGFPRGAVVAAVAAIRSHSSLNFVGLHCHIGSQIFDANGFTKSAQRVLKLHRELLVDGEVPELNLGGGFGISYTTDDPMPVSEIASAIAQGVSGECARLGIAVPRLAFEPGRLIMGPSTFTLYEVGTVKDVAVRVTEGTNVIRRYISVDGGMSDNIRPSLYGAEYSVRIANRRSTAAPQLVRVAGKHCESGDIVVNADYLPGDVHPGDLVAVPGTGAYCWSLSNNYNYLGRPPVVAVRNGDARLIVRGESEEDLLARDMGARDLRYRNGTEQASDANEHVTDEHDDIAPNGSKKNNTERKKT
jgi:diaminopimelate decarboxylase